VKLLAWKTWTSFAVTAPQREISNCGILMAMFVAIVGGVGFSAGY
jgi:hypothetical protein